MGIFTHYTATGSWAAPEGGSDVGDIVLRVSPESTQLPTVPDVEEWNLNSSRWPPTGLWNPGK